MRLSTIERDGVACLLLRDGDALDVSCAPELRSAALEALDRGLDVAVDLSCVEFLDSAGIGALVVVVKQARSRGLRARLAAVGASARATLALIRLDEIFDLSPDLDAAIRACRSERDAPVR